MHYFLFDCHALPCLAGPFWFGGTESMVTNKAFRTSLLGDPHGPTEELVQAKKSDRQTQAEPLCFDKNHHKPPYLFTSSPHHVAHVAEW